MKEEATMQEVIGMRYEKGAKEIMEKCKKHYLDTELQITDTGEQLLLEQIRKKIEDIVSDECKECEYCQSPEGVPEPSFEKEDLD